MGLKLCVSGFSLQSALGHHERCTTISLLPPYSTLQKKAPCTAHPSGVGDSVSSSQEMSISMNYLEFFCMGEFFSLLFIYSIIYLCLYGLVDVYLIHEVIIWYCLVYFLAQFVPALAIWNSFSQLFCPFDTCSLLCGFEHFSDFLELNSAPGMSCLPPAPTEHFSRIPVSFKSRMVFRRQDWTHPLALPESPNLPAKLFRPVSPGFSLPCRLVL